MPGGWTRPSRRASARPGAPRTRPWRCGCSGLERTRSRTALGCRRGATNRCGVQALPCRCTSCSWRPQRRAAFIRQGVYRDQVGFFFAPMVVRDLVVSNDDDQSLATKYAQGADADAGLQPGSEPVERSGLGLCQLDATHTLHDAPDVPSRKYAKKARQERRRVRWSTLALRGFWVGSYAPTAGLSRPRNEISATYASWLAGKRPFPGWYAACINGGHQRPRKEWG